MIIDKLSEIAAAPVPFILIGSGAYFFAKLKLFRLFTPSRLKAALFSKRGENGNSPFRAMTLALAGTLGVGNIVGVAGALAIGGPGSVFWMWVSAVFAMALKYSETALAVSHRRVGKDGFYGGAVYYIRDFFAGKGLDGIGKAIAAVFAVLFLFNGFTTGCAVQSGAAADALGAVYGIPPAVTGTVLAAVVFSAALTGGKGISKLTEIIVPVFSAVFVVMSFAVLTIRADAIPGAFASIFENAFTPDGVSGGMIGFVSGRAVRVGTVRGLLSNEAGCGTSPTAHAAADTDSPAAQGVFGIAEVFVDTVVLCTLPALVMIINSDAAALFPDSPVSAAVSAYSASLGSFAGQTLAVLTAVFGLSTLLCWVRYGTETVSYLFPRSKSVKYLFPAIFCVTATAGAVIPSGITLEAADIVISLLTLSNTAVLLLSEREIEKLTRLFINDRKVSRRNGRCP